MLLIWVTFAAKTLQFLRNFHIVQKCMKFSVYELLATNVIVVQVGVTNNTIAAIS